MPIAKITADVVQIIKAVADMRATITELEATIVDAKARQVDAAKDVKRIEKDMNEFTNNKGRKLAELQKSLDSSKKAHVKQAAAIKPLQQEARESKLDMEQCSGDLAGAQENLDETTGTLSVQEREVGELAAEQKRMKVCNV